MTYGKVFSDAEEEILKNYLKRTSDIYCDFPAREARMFAFEYAGGLNIKIHRGWNYMTVTGTEWFRNFCKRHRAFLRANLT